MNIFYIHIKVKDEKLGNVPRKENMQMKKSVMYIEEINEQHCRLRSIKPCSIYNIMDI